MKNELCYTKTSQPITVCTVLDKSMLQSERT